MQSFKLFLKLKFALSKGPKYIIFYPIITETLSKNLEVFYFRLKKKKSIQTASKILFPQLLITQCKKIKCLLQRFYSYGQYLPTYVGWIYLISYLLL